MKKIILILLLVSGFVKAEDKINPKSAGPLEEGRLISQYVTGHPSAVITDLKTGCQYLIFSGGSYGTSLGCFPELIDPKFKK